MSEFTKVFRSGDGDGSGPKRPESQATLSAIGDVTIAATAAVDQLPVATRKGRWLSLSAFLLFVYVIGSVVAVYTHQSAPWVQVLVGPLVLAAIALLAFWRRQAWKIRACDSRRREGVQLNVLYSLAHQAANSVNAIRANLKGIEDAESSESAAAHLRQVE